MRSNIIFITLILLSLYFVNFITKGEILKYIVEYKKINQIEFINVKNVSRKYILKRISVKEGQSFWLFNPFKLKKELDNLVEVKDYSFKLNWNGVLEISIEEKKPFMKWITRETEEFIDINGHILKLEKKDKNIKIIKLFGKHANLYIGSIRKILLERKDIYENTRSILFQNNLGWQINLSDNNCVLIPLKKLDKVMDIFQNIKNSNLYSKFNFFDLRIIGRVYMSNKKC